MAFTGLILPLTKNICRTCLMETEPESFMNIQDVIEHDMIKIKLIDILVYLNCLENNDEDNWPQGICSKCVSTSLAAYNFKIECLKATLTLSRILMIQSPINFPRSDINTIDINVVYQDHQYDLPLFSNHNSLDFESSLPENKELTPLPPVTEITSTEQPPRQEGDKKYACTICNKSFTRISGLHYHMNKHSDVMRYLCTKCGKGFHTPGGLRQHAKSHKETAQFKCGFCNKMYRSRQSLKEHFRVAHSSNRRGFVCVTCGKRFTMRSTLMMHSKIHSGVKFPCPSCPKVYSRATYLNTHSIVHSSMERPSPFSCTHANCGRRFATKHSLTVHIAHAHTTERSHKCDICNKGFATQSGLKIHMNSHMRNEICCNICGKKLSNRRGLQKHLKTHDIDTNDMILETVADSVFFDHYY